MQVVTGLAALGFHYGAVQGYGVTQAIFEGWYRYAIQGNAKINIGVAAPMLISSATALGSGIMIGSVALLGYPVLNKLYPMQGCPRQVMGRTMIRTLPVILAIDLAFWQFDGLICATRISFDRWKSRSMV